MAESGTATGVRTQAAPGGRLDATPGTGWVEGDPVEWTSEVTGERHRGRLVAMGGGPDGDKGLVAPDHPNLRWSAWVAYTDLNQVGDDAGGAR